MEKPTTLIQACRLAIEELGVDAANKQVAALFKKRWPQYDTTGTAWPSSVTQARREARGQIAPPGADPTRGRGARPAGTSAGVSTPLPLPAAPNEAGGQASLELQLRQLATLVGPDRALKLVQDLLNQR